MTVHLHAQRINLWKIIIRIVVGVARFPVDFVKLVQISIRLLWRLFSNCLFGNAGWPESLRRLCFPILRWPRHFISSVEVIFVDREVNVNRKSAFELRGSFASIARKNTAIFRSAYILNFVWRHSGTSLNRYVGDRWVWRLSLIHI